LLCTLLCTRACGLCRVRDLGHPGENQIGGAILSHPPVPRLAIVGPDQS
jgi:hypothetical protein